jgi:hypothetical protein
MKWNVLDFELMVAVERKPVISDEIYADGCFVCDRKFVAKFPKCNNRKDLIKRVSSTFTLPLKIQSMMLMVPSEPQQAQNLLRHVLIQHDVTIYFLELDTMQAEQWNLYNEDFKLQASILGEFIPDMC